MNIDINSILNSGKGRARKQVDLAPVVPHIKTVLEEREAKATATTVEAKKATVKGWLRNKPSAFAARVATKAGFANGSGEWLFIYDAMKQVAGELAAAK